MRKSGDRNEQGFKQLRSRAQKALRKRSADLSGSPVEDVQKLIHELRVHQLQLEMQTEELRKAQLELSESRDRYLDLYDFAPIGYFTLDEKGLILEVNLAGADLLGSERASLIKKRFSQFVAQGSQELFYSHCKRALETQSKQVCEIELRRKGERSFWAQIQSVATKGNEGNSIWLRTAAVDITQRKRAEEALSEAHSGLEQRGEERTTDLMMTNAQLQKEIEERKQDEQSLRESEGRYRILVETMNEGLGVVDERDVWTYVLDERLVLLP